MSPPSTGETQFKIFGQFGEAVSEGRAIGRSIAKDFDAAVRFTRPICRFLWALFVLLLLGISSWGSLLLRRRIGLCYAFWSWALAMVTLLLFMPVARSAGAWTMLWIWWLVVFLAGFAHVLRSVSRLYGLTGRSDHVHRWSPGEPRRPVGWLVSILPGFVANNRRVQSLQEPIVLILIGSIVWGIDVMVFREAARPVESATAVFLLPVLVACATLFHMFILHSRKMLAVQVQRDSLAEQEASAESFQQISDEFNERGPEGLVSFDR